MLFCFIFVQHLCHTITWPVIHLNMCFFYINVLFLAESHVCKILLQNSTAKYLPYKVQLVWVSHKKVGEHLIQSLHPYSKQGIEPLTFVSLKRKCRGTFSVQEHSTIRNSIYHFIDKTFLSQYEYLLQRSCNPYKTDNNRPWFKRQ